MHTPTALRGLMGALSPTGNIEEIPSMPLNEPALVPQSLDAAFSKLLAIDPGMTPEVGISRFLIDQQARDALATHASSDPVQWTLLDTLTDEDQTYLDHDKALIAHLKRQNAYKVGDEHILCNRKVFHGPDAWTDKADQERVWQSQCTPGLYQAGSQEAHQLPFFAGRLKALRACQALLTDMKASPTFAKEFGPEAKDRGLVVITSPVNMTWARKEKLLHGEFIKEKILPGARYIVDQNKAEVQARGEVNGGVILDDKPHIPLAKGQTQLPFTHVRVETSRNQHLAEDENIPFITGKDFERHLLPVVLPRVIVPLKKSKMHDTEVQHDRQGSTEQKT